MMSRLTGITLLSLTLLLGACAGTPQGPVALNAAEALKPQTRVGVVMSAVPKADTHFPGADCLLCLAAASVANSTLTAHAKTLPNEDMAAVKSQVVGALKKKGSEVVVIDEALDIGKLAKFSAEGPNVAKQDFTPLKTKYGVDKLLVVSVDGLGIHRSYASYIPTSDPRAWAKGRAYMVNLSNNTYEWLQPFEVFRAADGAWSEPPKFPGLTNAYFQVIESAKDQLIAPLSQ